MGSGPFRVRIGFSYAPPDGGAEIRHEPGVVVDTLPAGVVNSLATIAALEPIGGEIVIAGELAEPPQKEE